jgi:hypothetical protein
VENTLAYYVTELIWAVKSFMDETPVPSIEKKTFCFEKMALRRLVNLTFRQQFSKTSNILGSVHLIENNLVWSDLMAKSS